MSQIILSSDSLSMTVVPDSMSVDAVVSCADSVFVGGQRVVEQNVLPILTQLDAQLLSPVVQALMLTVILLYLFVVYRRRVQMVEVLSWVIYSSPQPILESHIDKRTMLPWRLLGLFSLGSFAAMLFYKYVAMTLDIVPLLTIVGVLLSVAFVWLLQSLLLWGIGEVSLNQQFTSAVSAVRSFVVELAGIVLTPFVISYSFSGESGSEMLWWIIFSLVVIIIGIFSFKLLKMFVAARFSIFYLILYLCAVELFPMSLAVVVMLRLL